MTADPAPPATTFSSKVTRSLCFWARDKIKLSSKGFTKRMSIKLEFNSSDISLAKSKIEPKESRAISFSVSLIILAFPISIVALVFSIFSPGPEPLGYLTATGPFNK